MSADPKRRSTPPMDALVVAMALAPGVYTRNRMFDFFADVVVQRARGRAAMLRGVVAQVGRANVLTLVNEGEGPRASFVLRYEIAELRMTRVVQLSKIELATLRILAQRAGLATLPPDPGDRTVVEGALARLLVGDTAQLARAALE